MCALVTWPQICASREMRPRESSTLLLAVGSAALARKKMLQLKKENQTHKKRTYQRNSNEIITSLKQTDDKTPPFKRNTNRVRIFSRNKTNNRTCA